MLPVGHKCAPADLRRRMARLDQPARLLSLERTRAETLDFPPAPAGAAGLQAGADGGRGWLVFRLRSPGGRVQAAGRRGEGVKRRRSVSLQNALGGAWYFKKPFK